MKAETITIESVNEFTGEIYDFKVEPKNTDNITAALLAVQKQRKSLDDMEAQLKGLLEEHLAKNDYRPIRTKLGYDIRYVQSTTRTYDPTVVWNHLGHDLLMSRGVISIANGKLETLMADLVKENGLAPEDSRAILDSVTVGTKKPYVVLERKKCQE